MFTENLTFVQDEDESVILEGSELHQALINMGYNNFDSIPRVKIEKTLFQPNLPNVDNCQTFNQKMLNKIHSVHEYIFQEKSLKENQLQIILKSNILLDDHGQIIRNFANEQQSSKCSYKKILEWLPFISTTIVASFQTLIIRKQSNPFTISICTLLGYFIYTKLKTWTIIKNLKYFILLQNELHNLIKQSLKILRRTFRKKLPIENNDQDKLLGTEKFTIINTIRQMIIEIFKYLIQSYYFEASNILKMLPNYLKLNCILTKIETDDKEDYDERNYDKLKSLYYTFILIQSELMVIIANACNVKSEYNAFRILKSKLSQVIKNLSKSLSTYYLKLSQIMYSYQLSEIKPVQRVFRGVQNFKWQDTYIHLDLTSQRVQLAYKEIVSILELIDTYSDIDESNPELIESILEKMNKAYKEIENAKSFAEFTSLLIVKAQCKLKQSFDNENKVESAVLINEDKKTIVIIDKDPVIEDEVFEEYIKEEYLKPLYENSDESVVQNLKLDKLLAKNFMSELKEALIEKQKTMTDRELKALKRMYDRVLINSSADKNETNKLIPNKNVSEPVSNLIKSTQASLESFHWPQTPLPLTPLPPPPSQPSLPLQPPPIPQPPPQPPPLSKILTDTVIAEKTANAEMESKNNRRPIPLPRVKMLQSEDVVSNIQRFSIRECSPHVQFPSFRFSEETFLGSGENSEEENSENENNLVHENEITKEY